MQLFYYIANLIQDFLFYIINRLIFLRIILALQKKIGWKVVFTHYTQFPLILTSCFSVIPLL